MPDKPFVVSSPDGQVLVWAKRAWHAKRHVQVVKGWNVDTNTTCIPIDPDAVEECLHCMDELYVGSEH